jgi:hypothetical protein
MSRLRKTSTGQEPRGARRPIFGSNCPARMRRMTLRERDLDGVGVLEHGHGEAERGGGLRIQCGGQHSQSSRRHDD